MITECLDNEAPEPFIQITNNFPKKDMPHTRCGEKKIILLKLVCWSIYLFQKGVLGTLEPDYQAEKTRKNSKQV